MIFVLQMEPHYIPTTSNNFQGDQPCAMQDGECTKCMECGYWCEGALCTQVAKGKQGAEGKNMELEEELRKKAQEEQRRREEEEVVVPPPTLAGGL